MASIKDAFDEVRQDNFAIFKYILFTIPLFLYVLFCTNSGFGISNFLICTLIMFIYLFGFLIKCTHNVRKGANQVLPSLNILTFIGTGIKGTVALGPAVIINTWLGILAQNKIIELFANEYVKITFLCASWGIFISIMLTTYILFAKNFKVTDTYNLKIISDSCIDIITKVFFMIPGLLLINLIITGSITYLFWTFMGIPNIYCTYIWCMSIMFNLAMLAHYFAQLEYESIDDYKDEK